jgi:hypothetical protein
VSTRARWLLGLGVFAAYLLANYRLGGLRSDHFLLGGGCLAAWLLRGRLRSIALFFVPLLIMAVAYDAQRYFVASCRGTVHVGEPLALELALFGIPSSTNVLVTPASWWQSHTQAWLDAVTGASYLLFIPMFLGFAIWWRWREKRVEAQDMMWAMMWLNLAAYATYFLYAAAPPWYVDHYGLGAVNLSAPPESAGAARFDALFGVTWFAGFYGRSANVFGAIPSLHVGQTFLAALYAFRFRSLRVPAFVFWVLVTFSSVYLNHHYLIDGIIGMAYAVLALVGMLLWRRR